MFFRRRQQRSEAEAELARRIERIEDRLFLTLLTLTGVLLTILGTALVAVLLR